MPSLADRGAEAAEPAAIPRALHTGVVTAGMNDISSASLTEER